MLCNLLEIIFFLHLKTLAPIFPHLHIFFFFALLNKTDLKCQGLFSCLSQVPIFPFLFPPVYLNPHASFSPVFCIVLLMGINLCPPHWWLSSLARAEIAELSSNTQRKADGDGCRLDLEDIFPCAFVMLECISAWIAACVAAVRRESWRYCYTPKLPHDSLSEHIFSCFLLHFLKQKGFYSSHGP